MSARSFLTQRYPRASLSEGPHDERRARAPHEPRVRGAARDDDLREPRAAHRAARVAPRRLRVPDIVVKNAKSIGVSVLETPKRQLETPFRLREMPKRQRFGARNTV